MPERALRDRVAVVTGGGSGLGAAVARRLGRAGAHVVVAGRRQQVLARLAEELRSIGVETTPLVADVTDEESVERLFAETRRSCGMPEIVVANAGVAASAPIQRTTWRQFNEIVATNLGGVFLTLRGAVTELTAQPRTHGSPWGRLIVTASTAALRGYAYTTAYSASKHGALGVVRALAAELAATPRTAGITVNAVCPGFLRTEMTERTLANIVAATGRSIDEATAALAASNSGGRLVEPDEVADVILRLCLPGSEHTTGEAIEVDG